MVLCRFDGIQAAGWILHGSAYPSEMHSQRMCGFDSPPFPHNKGGRHAQGKTGITATLVGVQVMELVEYEGSGSDEFTYLERPTAELTEDSDEDIPF